MLIFQQTTKAQNQKPNIIFILGDDIGYKILTVNGGKSYSTPTLDSMAQNGMNFKQCQASPLCSPSRFLLLTGKYNFRNYTKWGIMDTGQRTIGNMFQDAGYKTACFGKWQLDGGGASLKKFGFDNYCIWLPFDTVENARYKDPFIYTNGAYIPTSVTLNQYGEDIFTDSVLNFIERNKDNPFFLYYPMVLAHKPFQPTPADSDFATWSNLKKSDTTYYASMISYMDKKIKEIVNKIKALGIENNTVIFYTGDNGTPLEVFQHTNTDTLQEGGKSLTTESGTHVPLIVDWPGTVKPGSVNYDLIGFTDFLPTLAHIAGIPLPTDYGPLDGVDFYPRLKGNKGTPRDWLFYDYDAHPGIDSLRRWAQTKEYKLYDTSLYNTTRLFYNIKKDVSELHPLSNDSLTANELSIKQELLKVINGYVHEGVPILANADLVNISDSSVILEDSVQVNGGSTIKTTGAVWSKEIHPDIKSSLHTMDGSISGPYQTLVKGLSANTTYYIRAYAKNIAGITYGNEMKFRTLLHSPVAIPATSINNTGFIAHWHSTKTASGYKLYVSTDSSFSKIKTAHLVQQFNTGINPIPSGWVFTGDFGTNDTIYKGASPSIQFKDSASQIITKKLDGVTTELQFWIQDLNTDNTSSFLVEGFDGTNWSVIKNIDNLPLTGTVKIFNATSGTPLGNNFIQFRFTYFRSKGSLLFDDVSIKYNTVIPFYVKGYAGLKTNDTSFSVTGLKAGTDYYYRIRAIDSNNTSDNSNAIPVTTCASQTCNGNNIERSNLLTKNNSLNINVFPNPASHAFTLTVESKSNMPVEIFVTDVYGKKIYQALDIKNNKCVFGKEFSSGVYFVHVIQGSTANTLKLIKEK